MFGDSLAFLAQLPGGQYGDILRRLFPGARVTSGYRGPDHPLTLKNPSSRHATGSEEYPGALDVAPIPGMAFGDFVTRAKTRLPVTGSLDEQANPKPWTTGPNWHLSLGAQPKVATQRRTLADIAKPDLNQMADVNMSTPSQMTLGGLSALSSLPEGKVPQHKGLFPGKDWRTIAGVVGDALMAYGGMQPIYSRLRAQQDQSEADRQFDREKLNATLEAQRERAMEPPQFVQNLDWWMRLPEPLKRQYLQYQDVTNPIAISTPQGTQRVPRTLGPQPGTAEDGFIFLGGDPADQNNWRPQ